MRTYPRRKITLNINPVVSCSLLRKDIDEFVRPHRHLVRRQKSNPVSLVPHKVIPKPLGFRVDEVIAELGITEMKDRCVVVLHQSFYLNPECLQVNLDVPTTRGLTYTSIFYLLHILFTASALRFKTTIRQVTQKQINTAVRQLLHLFQAIAMYKFELHYYFFWKILTRRTRWFVDTIMVITPTNSNSVLRNIGKQVSNQNNRPPGFSIFCTEEMVFFLFGKLPLYPILLSAVV